MKKNILKIGITTIITMISLVSYGTNTTYNGIDSIPLLQLHVYTQDSQEPTCTIVYPPAGCSGSCATQAEKVNGKLIITNGADTIYNSGEFVKKESGITIKVRGNASANRDKKSFKIKLQKKANLIPSSDSESEIDYRDKEWVLLNNFDRNLNTFIGFQVSKILCMPWTPRCIPVQLFLNREFRGLYFLVENVNKNNNCRVDLSDSGYIIELDPYWWNEDKWFVGPIYSDFPSAHYTFKYPDVEDLSSAWENAIIQNVVDLENNITSPSIINKIDFDSFTKWLIAQNVLGNHDALGSNIFLSKADTCDNAKFKLGPLWDFDGIMGMSIDTPSNSLKPYIFPQLLRNSAFIDYYQTFYNNSIESIFDKLIQYLDSLDQSPMATYLDSAFYYDTQKWGNPELLQPVSSMISDAKTYFSQRKQWMLTQIASNDSNTNFYYEDNTRYFNLLGLPVDKSTKGIIISTNGTKILNVR